MDTAPKQTLWSRTFVLLTLVQTMDLLAFHSITPVIAKYTLDLGAAVAASGLAASVFSLAAIFARPLSGFLSDRLGRRPIVLISIGVSAAMQLGYALVPAFGPLLCLRTVHGFFYALFGTAISAMALATVPESRTSEGMGWFGASYVVAAIIGPAMGVAISEGLGFTALFLTTTCIAAASFPLALVATKRPRRATSAAHVSENAPGSLSSQGSVTDDVPRSPSAQGPGTDGAPSSPSAQSAKAAAPAKARLPKLNELVSPRCLPLASIAMCFMASWAMIASYIVLVGEHRNVDGVALFFVANSLTLLVTRPVIGKITDQHGLRRLILPAIAIETCALLGICFAHELWVFLAAASFKAFGSGGVLPSIQAECGKLETPERSGVAMSTYLLGSDIGYAVGPLIGGVLASTVGYEFLLFGTLPITALALCIYLVWKRA